MTKRRIGSLVFLAFGLGIAFLLSNNAPQELEPHSVTEVPLGGGGPSSVSSSNFPLRDTSFFDGARGGTSSNARSHTPPDPSALRSAFSHLTASRRPSAPSPPGRSSTSEPLRFLSCARWRQEGRRRAQKTLRTSWGWEQEGGALLCTCMRVMSEWGCINHGPPCL